MSANQICAPLSTRSCEIAAQCIQCVLSSDEITETDLNSYFGSDHDELGLVLAALQKADPLPEDLLFVAKVSLSTSLYLKPIRALLLGMPPDAAIHAALVESERLYELYFRR